MSGFGRITAADAASIPGEAEAAAGSFLIASRKNTFKGHRYITFWRANRCGYAWSIPWAGLYSAEEAALVTDGPTDIYRDEHSYAVPLSVVQPLCVPPKPGDIDGDVGPVMRNTKAHWALIEAHAAILKARTAGSVGTDGPQSGPGVNQ